jgi:hypothetical protein
VTIREAGPYRELSLEFMTGEETSGVRFILEVVIGSKYDEGHITWDNCSLVRIK